jgi:hypothetical protein
VNCVSLLGDVWSMLIPVLGFVVFVVANGSIVVGRLQLCYAVLCYAMMCCAVLCYAMLCYAMLCYVVLCYDMLCCAVL